MKRKQFLSFFLIIALTFSMFRVSASANSETNPVVIEIQNVIESIASVKDDYGFEGVDLSCLWISNAIPVYMVENDSLVRANDMEFYPILSDTEDMLSMTYVSISDSNGVNAFLSPQLVPLLMPQINNDSQGIALIYDSEGLSCWNGNTLSLLLHNNCSGKIEGRTPISDIPINDFEQISLSLLEKKYSLNISQAKPAGYDDEAAYIDVPACRQPENSTWCWAACMASVVNHEQKTTKHTCLSVANTCKITDRKKTLGTDRMKELLEEHYGIVYEYTKYLYRDGDLLDILISLGHNHAVIGGFVNDLDGDHHVMVIRGIDFSANVCSVMNPEDTTATAKYRTGKIVEYKDSSGSKYTTLLVQDLSSGKEIELFGYIYIK